VAVGAPPRLAVGIPAGELPRPWSLGRPRRSRSWPRRGRVSELLHPTSSAMVATQSSSVPTWGKPRGVVNRGKAVLPTSSIASGMPSSSFAAPRATTLLANRGAGPRRPAAHQQASSLPRRGEHRPAHNMANGDKNESNRLRGCGELGPIRRYFLRPPSDASGRPDASISVYNLKHSPTVTSRARPRPSAPTLPRPSSDVKSIQRKDHISDLA
jgi:hypothetical protein